MPLCYSGQESANKKRLKFFTKDPIEWRNYEYAGFYKTLFDLKHKNKALWNGIYGGQPQKIETGNDKVYAYFREKDGDKVVVALNFSDKKQTFEIKGEGSIGSFNNVFSGKTIEVKDGMSSSLEPWDYIVLSNK